MLIRYFRLEWHAAVAPGTVPRRNYPPAGPAARPGLAPFTPAGGGGTIDPPPDYVSARICTLHETMCT